MKADANSVVDIIDEKISDLRPNYGYVEKYAIAEIILFLCDYELPEDREEIFELLKLALDEGL